MVMRFSPMTNIRVYMIVSLSLHLLLGALFLMTRPLSVIGMGEPVFFVELCNLSFGPGARETPTAATVAPTSYAAPEKAPRHHPPTDTADDNTIPASTYVAISPEAVAGRERGEGKPGGDDNPATSGANKGAAIGTGGTTGTPEESHPTQLAAPHFLHRESPIYPVMARRLGKEGKVVLALSIDHTGKLTAVEVIQGADYGFTEAAIEAVKKSTFAPARKDGRDIPVKALLTVHFRLE